MELLIIELTIIFIASSILSVLMRLLKLPTILAYIFTGLIVGPLALFGTEYFQDAESLEALSKIGITLLLFILGLEMKVSELRSVGKVAILTGIGQILFTSLIGFGLASIIGYDSREALYISIALTFSSTIVIVKLLSDKRDLNTLYGKISIGFLLIQDFVAIAALLILNGLSTGEGFSLISILLMLAKAALIFTITIFLSQRILPKIVHILSGNLEILFGFSIAWAFGIALLISSDVIGLSVEIGGFLAGLALANAVESLQIVSKIRTLRDFFIIIFFVHLGTTLQIDNISLSIIPALFFSLFVLVGNPLIVLIILTRLGYKSRTGLLSGLTVAQISEFSLIVIFLGNSIGHVSDQTTSMVTLVGIITFAISSYMIMEGDKIYRVFNKQLKHFEKKNTKENIEDFDELTNHVVVIGVEQMGTAILKEFKNKKDKIVAVDYNPEAVSKFREKGYRIIFGDIIEHEVMDQANIENARVVVSTIPNLEDNVVILQTIKRNHPEVEVIVSAEHKEYRKILEEHGADMVIAPFTLAGQMLSRLVQHEELKIKS
jgi:Kef-type K+ transport system membrane component KefB